MNTLQSNAAAARLSRNSLGARCRSAFTMFEVLLVVVALGLLAALVIPTVDRFIDATGDTAKTHNAEMLNQYMQLLCNAGVDTSTYTDARSAIDALTTGVDIGPAVTGGQPQIVRLTQAVNPGAYTFTPGNGTIAPRFTAKLGDRTQKP